MLAPVLARLSARPELARVRTDCSGRLFLVEVAPGVDAATALEAARAELGPRARPVVGAAAQLEAVGRGEPWFSAQDIRALSYLEARVLAARISDRVTRHVVLDVEATDRLEAVAVEEIRATVDRVHDEGGRSAGTWFDAAWPGIAAAIAERLRGAVGEATFAPLREALLRARE